jgi:hypothetical protein
MVRNFWTGGLTVSSKSGIGFKSGVGDATADAEIIVPQLKQCFHPPRGVNPISLKMTRFGGGDLRAGWLLPIRNRSEPGAFPQLVESRE